MTAVSVLLPTFARNRDGSLQRSIDSVLQQSFGDFELIIIDDGSRDGSQDTIARARAADPRIKVLRFDDNVGLPAYTSAVAFGISGGEFIAWQFDDCEWLTDHLEALLQAFASAPTAGVCYGQARVRTRHGEQILGSVLDRDLLAAGTNHVPNVSVMVRRSVYDQIGWHDPNIVLKRVNDFDFWCRAAKRFEFGFVDRPISIEHGLGLADSLGNTVTRLPDLMFKHMAIDRDTSLLISNMGSWRPFQPIADYSPMELRDFAFLTAEHFQAVGRWKQAMEEIRAFADDAIVSEICGGGAEWEPLLWFTREYRARTADNLAELKSFIQEQRVIIDEQAEYIQKQRKIIDQL